MTPVIFRTFRDGDVIALFPTIPSDNEGHNCSSYMHVGQHGDANYSALLPITRLATPNEYVDLQTELINIGYTDLKIYNRETQAMREARKKA